MGVSGVLGEILLISPLGDLFFSIAVVSNSMWCLAFSADLMSLVIALMCPCRLLLISVLCTNLLLVS